MDKNFLEKLGIDEGVIDTIISEHESSVNSIRDEIKKLRVETAVEKALTSHKAKNFKAVAALLNTDEMELMEDGSLEGLLEQLQGLKNSEDSKFLFENGEGAVIKGALPGEKGEENSKSVDLDSMSYEQLCEHFADV